MNGCNLDHLQGLLTAVGWVCREREWFRSYSGYITETLSFLPDQTAIYRANGQSIAITSTTDLLHRLGLLQIEAEIAIIIRCPGWFERDDFQRSVASLRPQASKPWWQIWRSPPAPVCRDPVFVSFCQAYEEQIGNWYQWESGLSSTLPKDIYQEIGRILHQHQATHGILCLHPHRDRSPKSPKPA